MKVKDDLGVLGELIGFFDLINLNVNYATLKNL